MWFLLLTLLIMIMAVSTYTLTGKLRHRDPEPDLNPEPEPQPEPEPEPEPLEDLPISLPCEGSITGSGVVEITRLEKGGVKVISNGGPVSVKLSNLKGKFVFEQKN